ncbi:sialidase family protein [Bacillus smithii]|uniref:sialidase family protein n=1 Tax=Bacillus smithii TaxID=1479 RepID=UPI003D208B96
MPTVTDTTVVNQAYDTSGNGGRKLVRLSNGWLVASAVNNVPGAPVTFFYVSKDNGATFTRLCYVTYASGSVTLTGYAIASSGTNVYVLLTYGNGAVKSLKFDAATVLDTEQSANLVSIYTETQCDGCSLDINNAGTKIIAAWASKNSAYPNSFNIRTAIGVINADGTVSWGPVNQLTTINISGYDVKNPSVIFIDDTNAVVVYENKGAYFTINARKFDGLFWSGSIGVSGNQSYSQSSPSVCIDKNGRIWVAWHGRDATDSGADNIRVAYSDDDGQTWSATQKLTSGSYNQQYPSITVNKNNEVFVLWHGNDASDAYADIRMIKYSNDSWGNVSVVSAGTTSAKVFPSALYDITLDFSTPLFIYKDQQNNKVSFYGTWIILMISPSEGNLGQKTSKNNLLAFSITTEDSMSPITVSINGTDVYTNNNPVSGTQYTINLSQAQWDAIKYGNGHTLVITMGDNSWTYTFDKRLAPTDDILSVVKGVQDLQTYLSGIKAQLASAIRSKGGTVNDNDPFSSFVSMIIGMSGRKYVPGTVTSSSTKKGFSSANRDGSQSMYYVTIPNLGFAPRLIILFHTAGVSSSEHAFYLADPVTNANTEIVVDASFDYSNTFQGSAAAFYVTRDENGNLQIPVSWQSNLYEFHAFE